MHRDYVENSLLENIARVTISGTTISALCIAAPLAYGGTSKVEAGLGASAKTQGTEAKGSILTGYTPNKGHMRAQNEPGSRVLADVQTSDNKGSILTGHNSNKTSRKSKSGPDVSSLNQQYAVLTGGSSAQSSGNQTGSTTAGPVKAKSSKSKGSVSVGAKPNSGSAVNLGNMTVNGQTPPVVETRHKEKKAKNIVSIRSAKQIRQLPDKNAAEALSRQPGVTLEEDSGAGRYVHIRGLAAGLSSVTFHGIKLPPTNPASPAGGGRAVALDTIPSGIIGSTTVTKTNMPDQDANALGGTIEITPKSIPASQNFILQGHIGGGAKTQPGTPVYTGSVTAGKRFSLKSGSGKYQRKPFSIVGTISYFNDKSMFPDREDSFANQNKLPHNAYSKFHQDNYRYHRRRLGYGGELKYSPTKNSHYYIDYFNSGYKERANKNELTYYNLAKGASVLQNGRGILSPNAKIKDFRAHYLTKTNTQLVTFGGKNHFKNFSINYHGSYAKGTYHNPWRNKFSATFTQSNPSSVTYNNTATPNHPRFSVNSGPGPTQIRGYNLSGINRQGRLVKTGIWTGAVNLSLPTNLFSQSENEKLKFGLKTRLLHRTNHSTGPHYKKVPHIPLSSVSTNRFTTEYHGQYVNPAISDKKLRHYYYSHPGQFAVNRSATRKAHAEAYSNDNENVYAGYFQYHVSFGKLGVLAGMRLEGTQTTYRANTVKSTKSSSNGYTVTPNKNKSSYFDYFPSLQVRYAFTPRLIGRFVYSTAIARPGFTQKSASETLKSFSNNITRGNPNLQPTTDNAFDFSLAYYMPHGGVVSINPFDKELNNYIVGTRRKVQLSNSGQYSGFTGKTTIHSYKNINSARVYGVELNYRQKFSFLPGALSGLGAKFNYTYAHSRGKTHPNHSTQLPETSKNTLNAGIFYNHHGIGLDAAVQYRSKDIFQVGKTPSQDVYSQPRLTLDVGSHYRFNKHFGLYFDAKNLLNTPLRFTVGKNSNHLIQREYYGPTFTAGIRYNFGGSGSYASGADKSNHA